MGTRIFLSRRRPVRRALTYAADRTYPDGTRSQQNQQLEDHYFGAIPTRVAAFMKDLEIQSIGTGHPIKTRHNEVAPNQFKLAPIFRRM